MVKTLIKNAKIYDGSGDPAFFGDVLIEGERIVRVDESIPAERFGLRDRGCIRPGYYADLTVFSEEELKTAVPDQKKSFGIRKVWINGSAVLDGGTVDRELTKTSGRSIFV